MDHAKRRFTRHAAKHRQRDEMVATCRHRGDTALRQRGVEALDPIHTVLEVDRVRPDIAKIGTIDQSERRHARDRVHRPDHRRQVAQLARSVPWSGAVRCAGIPGNTNQRHLDLVDARRVQGQVRQPHETRHACKTRHLECGDRGEEIVVRHASYLVNHAIRHQSAVNGTRSNFAASLSCVSGAMAQAGTVERSSCTFSWARRRLSDRPSSCHSPMLRRSPMAG